MLSLPLQQSDLVTWFQVGIAEKNTLCYQYDIYEIDYFKLLIYELIIIFILGKSESTIQRLGDWKEVYEAGIIIWIIFGLGYLFMLINIITGTLSFFIS